MKFPITVRGVEICTIIPQGPDILMLDEVRVLSPDHAVGLVKITEERCAGHFDTTRGFPLFYPAYKMLEGGAQTGLTCIMLPEKFRRRIPTFSRECVLKPRYPVVPRDELVIEARVTEWQKHGGVAAVQGFVKKQLVFEITFGFTLIPPELQERLLRSRFRQRLGKPV